jgi:hypothetical protein
VKEVTTKALVEELAKREGVREITAGPDDECQVSVWKIIDDEGEGDADDFSGPARILIVTD